MDTWLGMLLVIAICLAFILGLGFLSFYSIVYASKRYLQKQRQRDEQWILSLLPGKDCADCGKENCSEFARQVAQDRGFCAQCPWMDGAAVEQIEEGFAQRQKDLQDRLEQTKAAK